MGNCVKLREKENLVGKLNNKEINVYPELEDLTVTPSLQEQTFKSSKYGYDNVTVEPIENNELTIKPKTEEQNFSGVYTNVDVQAIADNELTVNPSNEEQSFEDVYTKVTVSGDENLIPDNIRQGKNIFGVEGTMEGAWDTSQIRYCDNMFREDKEMLVAPFFNTENVLDMENMFRDCVKLQKIPLYNTINVKNMSYMFFNCSNLSEVPLFNTSNVTTMNAMFYQCINLKFVPLFNTENVKNLQNMFYSCSQLKEIPEFNTKNVTSCYGMFSRCSDLQKVPLLNAEKITSINTMFYLCRELQNLGGFKDLGKAYISKVSNYSSYKLDLYNSTLLTHNSLLNVINNLYDLNIAYSTIDDGTLYTQTLQLGQTNLDKLSAEEIAIATEKGWNVTA